MQYGGIVLPCRYGRILLNYLAGTLERPTMPSNCSPARTREALLIVLPAISW